MAAMLRRAAVFSCLILFFLASNALGGEDRATNPTALGGADTPSLPDGGSDQDNGGDLVASGGDPVTGGGGASRSRAPIGDHVILDEDPAGGCATVASGDISGVVGVASTTGGVLKIPAASDGAPAAVGSTATTVRTDPEAMAASVSTDTELMGSAALEAATADGSANLDAAASRGNNPDAMGSANPEAGDNPNPEAVAADVGADPEAEVTDGSADPESAHPVGAPSYRAHRAVGAHIEDEDGALMPRSTTRQRPLKRTPHVEMVGARQMPLKIQPRCSWDSIVSWFEALPAFQQSRLDRMGIGAFLRLGAMRLNHGLLQCIAEKYSSSTYSIVTSLGEFIPSLEDMVRLTGLPVHGQAVTGRREIDYRPQVKALLGHTPPVDNSAVVSMGWLSAHFGPPTEPTRRGGETEEAFRVRRQVCTDRVLQQQPGEQADRELRGFLMYLFGGLLFSTGSSRISLIYLQLTEVLDRLGDYAWGAAALAHLHGELRKYASGNTNIGGFLPFLQFWAFEHFNLFCPVPRVADLSVFPRAARWIRGKIVGDALFSSFWFGRGYFEKLGPSLVNWEPYRDAADLDQPVVTAALSLFGRDIWLLALHIVAFHAISRARRQIGLIQGIPREVPPVERVTLAGPRKEQDLREVYADQLRDWKSGGTDATAPILDAKATRYWPWFQEVYHDRLLLHKDPLYGLSDFPIGGQPALGAEAQLIEDLRRQLHEREQELQVERDRHARYLQLERDKFQELEAECVRLSVALQKALEDLRDARAQTEREFGPAGSQLEVGSTSGAAHSPDTFGRLPPLLPTPPRVSPPRELRLTASRAELESQVASLKSELQGVREALASVEQRNTKLTNANTTLARDRDALIQSFAQTPGMFADVIARSQSRSRSSTHRSRSRHEGGQSSALVHLEERSRQRRRTGDPDRPDDATASEM